MSLKESVYIINLTERHERKASILLELKDRDEFRIKVISVHRHKIGAIAMLTKISKISIPTIFLSILLLLSLFSCNNTRPGLPLYNPTLIVDSVTHFWSYWYYDVNLSRNYVAFDTNNKKIPKKEFLKKLSTGNYLPLKLESEDPTTDQYQLVGIKTPVDREGRGIYRYLAFFGRINLKYFNMEGEPVPNLVFRR